VKQDPSGDREHAESERPKAPSVGKSAGADHRARVRYSSAALCQSAIPSWDFSLESGWKRYSPGWF
jgi:hypothetical protein